MKRRATVAICGIVLLGACAGDKPTVKADAAQYPNAMSQVVWDRMSPRDQADWCLILATASPSDLDALLRDIGAEGPFSEAELDSYVGAMKATMGRECRG